MPKLLILALLLCAAAPAADPGVRELFEKARMMAETNRNLNEAIRLFGEVIRLAGAYRALAAQAQYRQGLLYERLGRKAEALKAFRAVVTGYSDQRDLAALARAKLPPVVPEVTNRRIWAGAVNTTGSGISPDGDLLSFTDWRTGDLMVHDFETGENRRLTSNTALNQPEFEFALSSAFSRDGRWLAYSWQPPGENTPMEVRIIGRDGTGRRTVFKGTGSHPLFVNDWTPDGKHILATGAGSLWLIPAAGGAPRAIPVSRGGSGRAFLSPDGAYAAYNTGAEVRVVSLATGENAPLLEHAAGDSMLGWAAGGELVFKSNRSGAPDIWSVQVVDGKASGGPQRRMANVDPSLTSLGVTAHGTLLYAVDTVDSELFVSELDPVSGQLSAPKVLSESFAASKRSPAWSPDGNSVVYAAKNTVRLYDVRTGTDRDVAPKLANVVRVIAWRPGDAHSIYVEGVDTAGKGATFLVNVDSGAVRAVLGMDQSLVFSRDANTVFARTQEPGGILRHNLATNEATVLYKRAVAMEIANPKLSLSPDETMLALQLQNVPRGFTSMAVMPVAGGEPRVLFRIPQPELFGFASFAWTPDMRFLYFARNLSNHSEIWRVPVEGGAANPAGISVAGLIRHLRLNPDGRRFVFTNDRSSTEIWKLENFLPAGR